MLISPVDESAFPLSCYGIERVLDDYDYKCKNLETYSIFCHILEINPVCPTDIANVGSNSIQVGHY